MQGWPEPKYITELRSFIGLCSYYRRFILGYADIATPLYHLTSKTEPFTWTSEWRQALKKLKNCLYETSMLAHQDFTKKCILDIDVTDFTIGGCSVLGI